MKRRALRSTLAWTLFAVLGCSTGSSSCGGCSEPLPAPIPADLHVANAATAKVSRAGLGFIESRVNEIIGTLAADGLSFQVPCTNATQQIPIEILGFQLANYTIPVFACDHTDNNSCSEETAGTFTPPRDDQYKPTSPPMQRCQAKANVKALKITPTQASPTAPVSVAVRLELAVNTGTIALAVDLSNTIWPVTECGKVRCGVEFDSNSAAPNELPIDVGLKLTLDPDGNLLSFNLDTIDVSKIVDERDLRIFSRSSDVDCSVVCDAADIDLVKGFIFDYLKDTINVKVRDIIDTFRCRSCDANNSCPSGSTCVPDQGVCYKCDPASPAGQCRPMYKPDETPANDVRICPPALLGMEGRIGAGELLASFGGSTDSLLDVHAAAGTTPTGGYPARVENQGIVIAMRAATRSAVRDATGTVQAPATALCVPQRTFGNRSQPPVVNFDDVARELDARQAGSIADYHLGIAIADNTIDKGMFDAYASGLLCLNLDSNAVSLLSSSTFSQFINPLSVLTDGKDVPMLIALRPKYAPEVRLGKGTVRQEGNDTVPDDPLLTVSLKELQLDFYVLLEERYSRVFSVRTDVELPLSLDFDPARNTVRPILANLDDTVRSIRIENAEMLPTDTVEQFQRLIESILGLVQRALGSALGPIELPSFSGFKLGIRDQSGAVPYADTRQGFQHLVLFADLGFAPAAPFTNGVDTFAELVDLTSPEPARILAGERTVARLRVGTRGLQPAEFQGWEYSFRVDGGLWSPWTRNELIDVKSAVLLLQGRHNVEVRSREIGHPESEDASPASVSVVVDQEAPSVRLELDTATNVVRTIARDSVSTEAELRYSYRVAGAGWTASGAARTFELSELGALPSLEVEVTDAAGRTARAIYGMSVGQLEHEQAGLAALRESQGGCASASVAWFAILAVIGFGLRRRARA